MAEKTSWFKYKNRRRSREIAAPVRAVVAVGPDDVLAVLGYVQEMAKLRAKRAVEAKAQKGRVARALDTSNEEHYVHIGAYKDAVAASYPLAPGAAGKVFGPWVAVISMASVDGGTEVTTELLQWTEADGVLRNSEEYLWFLDQFAQQLASLDPRSDASATLDGGELR
jgi:hypothetical protein